MGRFGDWKKGPSQKTGWCIHYLPEKGGECRIRVYVDEKEKAVGEVKKRVRGVVIRRVHEPGKTPSGVYVPAYLNACDVDL